MMRSRWYSRAVSRVVTGGFFLGMCWLLPADPIFAAVPSGLDAGCADYTASNHLVGWHLLPSEAPRVDVHRDRLYLHTNRALEIWTLPGSGDFRHTGTIPLPEYAGRLLFDGDTVYVGTQAGLVIADIADPERPTVVGGIDRIHVRDIAIQDGVLYVAAGLEGLLLFDVADPAHPELLRAVAAGSNVDRVALGGRYGAYSIWGGDVRLVHLIDPRAPLLFLQRTYPRSVGRMAFHGAYLLLSFPGDGTHVYHLAGLPGVIDQGKRTDAWGGFSCDGDTMVVAMADGLHVLDLGGLPEIRAIRTIPETGGAAGASASGGHAYFMMGLRKLGVADYRIPDISPSPTRTVPGDGFYRQLRKHGRYLYGFVTLPSRSAFRISELGPDGDPVTVYEAPYLHDGPTSFDFAGDCVVFSGWRSGVTIMDVGDPLRASIIGSAPLAPRQVGLDVCVDGRFAYVASEGHDFVRGALWMYDLTNPMAPVAVKQVEVPNRALEVERIGDTAFLLVEYQGLYAWDISPGVPTDASALCTVPRLEQLGFLPLRTVRGTTGMICVGDIAYILNDDMLRAVDCSDPTDMRLLATCVLPGSSMDHSLAYDGGYLYVSTYSFGVVVIDVREPAAARVCGFAGPWQHAGGVGVVGDELFVGTQPYDLQVFKLQCGPGPEVWSIDIKPGSETNPVNCHAERGLIPVAICSTPEHDALEIDVASVRFGPAGGTEAGSHGSFRHREVDVDGDGDLDLLFHFRFGDTGIRCGDTEATLRGSTRDGRRVVGTDRIRTVGRSGQGRGEAAGDAAVVVAPNPFNPRTTITLTGGNAYPARLAVYDVRGGLVAELVNGPLAAGTHEFVWEGCDGSGRSVPSGTYFLRCSRGEWTETRKLVLLR